MRIRWVKIWVDSMASLTERFRDEDGRIDFEALGREEYAFRHALITGDFSKSARARDLSDATMHDIKIHAENGKKGSDARWKKNAAGPMPSDKQAVYDFANDEKLDVNDAYECWTATMERGNRTSRGEIITDWKSYVKSWCATRAKRRTA